VTLSPVLPEPWPWIVVVALPLLGGFLAWRANQPLPRNARVPLTAMRVVAFTAMAWLLLNPGRWKEPEREEQKLHAILLDRSASMNVRDVDNVTRWDRGRALTQTLVAAGGDKVKAFAFAADLEGDALAANLKPDGAATAIVHSAIGLFSGAAGLGRRLASVTIISDGRQTREDAASELVLRAQAAGVPVHVVPLGTDWGGKDLIVHVARRLVMTLPGRPVTIGAILENRGLGFIKPQVYIADQTGKSVASRSMELNSGEKKFVAFDVPKLAGGEYRIVAPPQSGEDFVRNNEDRFRVQELAGRTRVFIAEGAPYWDSKFLAQLLREEGFMDVKAVYRLNAGRYFRVDAGKSEPVDSGEGVFPEKPEDFAKLDLMVLGKGSEGFLTEERITALKNWVRDSGGALLMARGKSYAGKLASLEAVEPVEWGNVLDGEFRFEPGSVGEAAGLFGQVLPEAGDPLWRQLPPLRDVAAISRLKPFTQVLSMGTRSAQTREERVPLLVARHFGRGVVVAMNADGLWKWDFDPQARKLGNMYEEFWTQLLQWTASYAEFLPGQELSLRLAETTVQQGRATRATIGWRGGGEVPKPQVRIFLGDRAIASVTASEGESDSEGRRSWTALVQLAEAGTYRLQAFNGDKPGPEVMLNVQAPPTEQEALAADVDFLRRLADDTGGRSWKPEEAAALGKQLFEAPPSSALTKAKAEWQPLWPLGWIATGLVGLLGIEWWGRRRRGLL